MAEPTTWTVTGQRETTILAPGGGTQDAVNVSYETGKGNKGTVTIPKSQYTPTHVHKKVTEAATNADAVSALSSESPPSESSTSTAPAS
jgi:hypothetical protein